MPEFVKTPEECRDYLDDCIRRWRVIREVDGIPAVTKTQAEHYIDAFQTTRLVCFGACLPD